MTAPFNDARPGGAAAGGVGRSAAAERALDPPLDAASPTSRFEVRVPTPEDGDVVVDIRTRRSDVVHRLLGLGVSRSALVTLLPEWSDLIDQVADDLAQPARRR